MAKKAPRQIDPLSMSQLIASDGRVAVLNIRESCEREVCTIEGGTYFPMNQLPVRVMELPKDRTLAVARHHGMRSFHATMWLRDNGFPQAVNIAGAIDAWAVAILPGMQRYWCQLCEE